MSICEHSEHEDNSHCSFNPQIELLKSPARLLAHLEKNEKNESLKNQLVEAAQWILCSPDAIGFCRLTALCYEVPIKLQDGPQCGLVALWMASNALIGSVNHKKRDISESCQHNNPGEAHVYTPKFDLNKFPAIDWIQNMAKHKQFSKKGEMFSADNLALLAEICFQDFLMKCTADNTLMSAHVIKNDVLSFLTSYDKMVEFFTDPSYHQVLLVPYDSDHDQRPCTKKGHKSHWCVISGIASFVSNIKIPHIKSLEQANFHDEEESDDDAATVSNNNHHVEFVDDSSKLIVISKSKMLPKPYNKINEILKNEILNKKQEVRSSHLGHDEEASFYLIARQSKSKRTFLFDPHNLALSNRNLIEVYTNQYNVQTGDSYDEIFNRYVIPSGGLREGLANQVIVLRMQVV